MAVDRNWKCINCGFADDISLYNDKLRKPNFVIAPILPTCNVCGCEVQLASGERSNHDNRVFVLTGPIGSGKTSTAEHLFSRHGFNAVDHDCIIDLASHKHNSKVEFNDPEAIAAIEDNLDILLAFKEDIVLSLVILPLELDMYRSMLQKRKLDYRIFFLCPDYDTALQRTRTRTCFRSVTPEKWVKHFYEKTEPFKNIEGEDVILLDNTGLTVEESVATIFAQFQ
jgi:shikimate kinase